MKQLPGMLGRDRNLDYNLGSGPLSLQPVIEFRLLGGLYSGRECKTLSFFP